MSKFALAIAVVVGMFFAWVDSRPTWDDTGVLVMAIVLSSAMFAALAPQRPWLIALAVGAWIPLHNIIAGGDWGTAITIVFALVGAYAGSFARRAIKKPGPAA